jgi:5-methylcytosine-specific restriction endonuclease McrA
MRKIQPQNLRVRLDPESYLALHRQILKRDNWRCQSCGSMKNLQVHHLTFRSHSGGDVEQNLITLCAACHGRQHAVAEQSPL